jgi:hypothetical protein
VQTEIFTLCDSATYDRGKLNILGSFDTIYAPQFPCHHHICAIACKLRFDLGEDGQHAVEISFCDPDMHPVQDPIRREFNVQMGDHLSHTHSITHHFVGFVLQGPGEYYFELQVDGNIKSRIPLYVREVEPPKV